LGRKQRLATQFKKVVVNADRLDAEQLLPNSSDRLVGLVARHDAIGAQLRSRVQRGGFCARLDRGGGLEIDLQVDARLEIGR
jgi:hypothetical protein